MFNEGNWVGASTEHSSNPDDAVGNYYKPCNGGNGRYEAVDGVKVKAAYERIDLSDPDQLPAPTPTSLLGNECVLNMCPKCEGFDNPIENGMLHCLD